MAARTGFVVRRLLSALCLTGVAFLLAGTGALDARQQPDDSALERSAERLRALQKEADALAAQQRTLLGELRTLELERQISIEQLGRIEKERTAVEQQMTAAELRADELAQAATAQVPEVEAQLVQLYKQGRAGYWRLLLSAHDLDALGRAYRAAAMMTIVARARAEEHDATLDALARERQALQVRADEIAALEAEARRARSAAEKAVAARTALVNSIDTRRDLNATLMGELQAAQERLQASLSGLGTGVAPALPLHPFRGDLPWPVRGNIVRPFGRQPHGAGGTLVSNGIEIAAAEGQPVRAVHEGSIAFAGPFSGYGNLVIVEHGSGSHSLYGYLGAVEVRNGQRISAQAMLGASGRNAGGTPGLYFELRVDGAAVDPVQWLRR